MPRITLPPVSVAGQAVVDIDTPALMLDLAAFERNLHLMQQRVAKAGLRLRPHAKAHKCPEIALRQIAAGAQGICCQKVTEAIPFIEAGITDIHISNEIASPAKAELLAQLARVARMSVCVDDEVQVAWLQDALTRADARLDVFIEADVGQGRCGVSDESACVRLAHVIERCDRLHFKGLQAYHGGAQHERTVDERRSASALSVLRAASFVQALADAGMPCDVVTGGGTGSVEFDVDSGVYTEVQPGSYVFMDGDYGRNVWHDSFCFEHSLFIVTAVMSRTRQDRVVVDAGLKSMAVDSGLPFVWNQEELTFLMANDEHGIVGVNPGGRLPSLGEHVRLVPGHCDPTLNLYDSLVVFRDDTVEGVWPVAARGLSR